MFGPFALYGPSCTYLGTVASRKYFGSGVIELSYGTNDRGDCFPCMDSGIRRVNELWRFDAEAVSDGHLDKINIKINLLHNLACWMGEDSSTI